MSRSQRDNESLASAGGIFAGLCPDEWKQSIWDVDYEDLYSRGCRLILFDIDNTLVHHGAPADERTRQLFRNLQETGISACVVSNNRKARVEPFAEAVGALYVCKAGKPSVRGYLEACRMSGYTPSQTVCIGDQLFTDIWGARRAGIRSILVNPISPREEIQIILKRKLERIILFFFRLGLRIRGLKDIPVAGFQEKGRAHPTGSLLSDPRDGRRAEEGTKTE